jgi:hypothetical protein
MLLYGLRGSDAVLILVRQHKKGHPGCGVALLFFLHFQIDLLRKEAVWPKPVIFKKTSPKNISTNQPFYLCPTFQV